MPLRRSDWFQFFSKGLHPHGVRIDMPTFTAAGAEARLMERRLVAIMRVHFPQYPFALRRSFQDGPGRIDCAFEERFAADELADYIGAVQRQPPVGFKTFRLLVADKRDCQRIWKLGQDKRSYPKKSMLTRLRMNGATKRPPTE